jgi:hypothetical protein
MPHISGENSDCRHDIALFLDAYFGWPSIVLGTSKLQNISFGLKLEKFAWRVYKRDYASAFIFYRSLALTTAGVFSVLPLIFFLHWAYIESESGKRQNITIWSTSNAERECFGRLTLWITISVLLWDDHEHFMTMILTRRCLR